jgi:mannose-6-phosphate isomerase-like protein (cupin superfamily)
VLSAHRDRRARELIKELNMEQASFFPDWRELVTFARPHPEPTLLRDESDLRVLVAGLEPGGKIPAHPERLAVYHILEGRGEMVVDASRFVLAAGTTVIAPRGSRRGIEARTRLAFLAVRVGPELERDD